jgi:hypothetical protein
MPRIKTTRTVTVALFLLRIYLLAMLLIILTKFVIEARGRGSPETRSHAATGHDTAPAAESQPNPVPPTDSSPRE